MHEFVVGKFYSDTSLMICPTKMNNLNEAGTVYFVQYKSTSESGFGIIDDKTEKKTHYAIAIDVTGTYTLTNFFNIIHFFYFVYRIFN